MSLNVKNISFRYKKSQTYVLKDFCAEFSEHKITALIGKNGRGKTTLAKIIMGILKPEAGQLILDGQDMEKLSLAERGKLIGYVMQNPERQIFSETVEEEVMFGLRQLNLSEKEIENRVDFFLSYFGLEHHRHEFPFALSHGEKQRLVLAAVLAMKPKYLILDEPTANLDFKRKKLLGEYLQGLNCGIIIISHDEEFVEQYCENVIKMEAPYEEIRS